ncbi:MAG: cyclophilin-like fold protein [Eubacteriales bacterium]|nr:cyclophilin-like fold protein [Eubacteriales bacterium]
MKKPKKRFGLKPGMILGIACMLVLGTVGCAGRGDAAEAEETIQDTEMELPEAEVETEQTDSLANMEEKALTETAQEKETGVTAESGEAGEESAVESGEAATHSDTEEQEEVMQIVLSVNGTELEVTWEDNETVEALRQVLENGDITVDTHQYGGFEQVGSLPQEFVRSDVQMTTVPGDIVLYSGNSVVLFYGSNSWAYTKLGHIENLTADELRDLLEREGTQVVFTLRVP